ncbi:MAG TPA: hypothetical protein VFQ54_08595, partial [Thermomicrobiales bacterium]|nr:hypothetical protein [Thermomicrobiales bacterium]
ANVLRSPGAVRVASPGVLSGKQVPLMSNPQNSLRFYIDQADDKAVVRAVPVKPVVATPRVATVEMPGEAVEVKQDATPEIRGIRRGRVATERVSRLVHRGRKHS